VIAAPGVWISTTDPHTFGRGMRISTFANGLNVASLQSFTHNYVSHFGWKYLFTSGSPDPRYLGGFGILHWWYAPLIGLGAVYAGRCARSRALCWWLWIWLAAYPLGGALTNDGVVPHAPRTIAGTPALCIFAAIGVYALLIHIGRMASGEKWRHVYRLAVCLLLAACVLRSVWSFSRYYLASIRWSQPGRGNLEHGRLLRL